MFLYAGGLGHSVATGPGLFIKCVPNARAEARTPSTAEADGALEAVMKSADAVGGPAPVSRVAF